MRPFLITLAASLLIGCIFASPAYCEEKPDYRLHPSDVLTITVHGQPDLTTKTRVTLDGCITFPLIGKLSVDGLTVQETESRIKELLEKEYLVNANVMVFIEEYHPRQVSVMGEVKNPGKYDMPGEKDLTLVQAIAMSGGFTKHADITKTRVMRMEDGKKKTMVINAKDITEKGKQDEDVVLKPDDIVFVPESFF